MKGEGKLGKDYCDDFCDDVDDHYDDADDDNDDVDFDLGHHANLRNVWLFHGRRLPWFHHRLVSDHFESDNCGIVLARIIFDCGHVRNQI